MIEKRSLPLSLGDLHLRPQIKSLFSWTSSIKWYILKGSDIILIELPTYPGTNWTWFISDIRYLQSSDLFSRSNALCKLCLRVAISFCSVNKHLTCPILPIFLRYFISSMASPSIKLNWKCPYFEQIAPNFQVTWSLSQCSISNQQH